MTALFRLNVVQSYIPIFNEKTLRLVRNVDEMVGAGQFNLYTPMGKCTLDMIIETSMGFDLKLQHGKNLDYLEALEKWVIVKRENIYFPTEVNDGVISLLSGRWHWR